MASHQGRHISYTFNSFRDLLLRWNDFFSRSQDPETFIDIFGDDLGRHLFEKRSHLEQIEFMLSLSAENFDKINNAFVRDIGDIAVDHRATEYTIQCNDDSTLDFESDSPSDVIIALDSSQESLESLIAKSPSSKRTKRRLPAV